MSRVAGQTMKIGAIVQARMASKRLQRKVMKEIMGKPILWHLVNRLRKSKLIDRIIIATTTNKEDNIIEEFANKHHLGIFRGKENDLADRYYNAAKKYNIDVIVRIWGDCPLIDPEIIDKAIEKYFVCRADYANNFNPSTFPLGTHMELYSFNTLEHIWKSTNDPFFREFPFEYVYANQSLFKTLYIKSDSDLSNIHFGIDYIEDFELAKVIFEKLYSKNRTFTMQDILDLIEKCPELKEMNKGLKRNLEYSEKLKMRKVKCTIHS